MKTEPYFFFERSEKPVPDFEALQKLISNYGLEPVNKVLSGGALWFEGARGEETMQDFVSDCCDIGCTLKYAKDAKALKHKSGWYLEVEPQYIEAFRSVFGQRKDTGKSVRDSEEEEPVIKLIKEAGFEYIDKRDKQGGLWIIADREEAKEFVEKCEKIGVIWNFAPNGSRTTKRRAGWYCR